MSSATRLSRLQPLILGKILRAVVSSTNLILSVQSFRRLLVITVNRLTPSLSPAAMPPLRNFQSDKKFPILTACLLSLKNAFIQLTSRGSIKLDGSFKRMLWSIRSNSLEKSAISILEAHHRPRVSDHEIS